LPYYFSTHGCKLLVSFGGAAFEDAAFSRAAAAERALLSKKFAIVLGKSPHKLELQFTLNDVDSREDYPG
jgi:hypothetical protein